MKNLTKQLLLLILIIPVIIIVFFVFAEKSSAQEIKCSVKFDSLKNHWTCTDYSGSFDHYCLGGNLTQFICATDNLCRAIDPIVCGADSTCINGSCLATETPTPTTTPCTDTDSSNNSTNKGTCTDYSGSFDDYCLSGNVTQFYCASDNLCQSAGTTACNGGWTCSNGACVLATGTPTPTPTPNGSLPTVSPFQCYGTNSDGTMYQCRDACENPFMESSHNSDPNGVSCHADQVCCVKLPSSAPSSSPKLVWKKLELICPTSTPPASTTQTINLIGSISSCQGNTIHLSWNSIPGATYYNVWRKTDSSTTWQVLTGPLSDIGPSPASSATTYDDDWNIDTTAKHTYMYSIHAQDTNINSDYLSIDTSSCLTPTPTLAVAAPTATLAPGATSTIAPATPTITSTFSCSGTLPNPQGGSPSTIDFQCQSPCNPDSGWFVYPGPNPSACANQGKTCCFFQNPSSGAIPTVTPTTPASGNTILTFSVGINGIGSVGNDANPKVADKSNKNPLSEPLNLYVQLFNDSNSPIQSKTQSITYNQSTGRFDASVDMGAIPTGKYLVKIKTPNTIQKQIPGIQIIVTGLTNTIDPINLKSGDLTNDNKIDIRDYNILIDCFDSNYATLEPKSKFNDSNGRCVSHPERNRLNDDLNRDGYINAVDYNTFVTSLSSQKGDE